MRIPVADATVHGRQMQLRTGCRCNCAPDADATVHGCRGSCAQDAVHHADTTRLRHGLQMQKHSRAQGVRATVHRMQVQLRTGCRCNCAQGAEVAAQRRHIELPLLSTICLS